MSKNVLIVDDSSVARKILRDLVAPYNAQILEASNGENALNTLTRHLVDLVICDLNMPGMDGLAFLEKIKKSTHLNTIPVALVTSESSFKSIEKAKNLGVIAFLVKPVSADQISTLLEII